MLLSPFYRQGNQGPEKHSHFRQDQVEKSGTIYNREHLMQGIGCSDAKEDGVTGDGEATQRSATAGSCNSLRPEGRRRRDSCRPLAGMQTNTATVAISMAIL